VIDALNHDMPFDRFTIDQIAGDMLPGASRDQLIASGFHRNAMTNEEGGIDPEEARYELLVDRVNTTATTWLGTTLGCAQCHDHKYDPFSQRDYYRMMAFFSNTDYEVRTFDDGTKFIEAVTDVPTPEQEAKRKPIQAEIDRLDEQLNKTTPRLARAQDLWEESMRREAALHWTVLTPSTLAAAGNVTLTAGPEGSVIASGANPGDAVYTIETATRVAHATAVRLEALPDPALPKGGPGRDVYGNFQLNGFEVYADAAAAAGALQFKEINADDSSGGSASVDSFFPKILPREESVPRGWRIDASREATRLPRQIVFTLAKPLTVVGSPAGSKGPAPQLQRLRIRLVHRGGAVGQAIGRFRLSVTSSERPQQIVEIPARLRPILTIAPAERTEQQQKDLAAFYRTVATLLKPARERRAELVKELKALDIPTALVMRERVSYERPAASIRRRGNFSDTGEKVYAGVPAVLPPLRDDLMPNRLGLAYWLVDEANPLTARVAVNRAWEQFFGRGLVETSEDFGTRGAPPSHPELLDWLATELVRQKWSMKAIHRLIVTSASYRQSSAATPALQERDPYNRMIARGPRFRMEAEMVRDTVLDASGLLSRRIGGPSVFPPQPDGIWDIPYSNDKWIASEAENRYRRGLYVFIRRSAPYPSFMTLDATSRERCTMRRVRTNTPLQALTLLNDSAFFELAQGMAKRILESGPSGASGRIDYAMRITVCRTPDQVEKEQLARLLAAELDEYKTHPEKAQKLGGGDQAAWTALSRVLLNTDEFITRE
jgi:hypothetical protein